MPSKLPKQNVILLILDGWGVYKDYKGNAIARANTPFYDSLVNKFPHTTMHASGSWVGLPNGQIGTSEVNHLTIGAGRILNQSLVRINQSIADKSFFENKALLSAIRHVKKNHSTLHLIGLYSGGGVHSHKDHVHALLHLAKQRNVQNVVLHLFTDGRDQSPKEGINEFKQLEKFLNTLGIGRIVTVTGRYYGMDRDENWGRTNQAFEHIMNQTGKSFNTIDALFSHAYVQDKTYDYFVKPSLLSLRHEKSGVSKKDAVIFFNFRADRMRQIVQIFLEKNIPQVKLVSMTEYKKEFSIKPAFPTQHIRNHLTAILDAHSITHHHVSETEKYAHVTYFFNGRREEPFLYEKRTHIKSDDEVRDYDERPWMRAPEITDAVIALLTKPANGFIIANFANSDLVGHTANIPATIEACEAIDKSLKKIIPLALTKNWTIMLTSDHGNAEMLIDPETGKSHTAHTLNPVPFIFISTNKKIQLKQTEAGLHDIAPTILDLMKIKKPKEMTGESLIQNAKVKM